MPFERDGILYFLASEVLEDLGISRQTLWRWRRQGSVPRGKRYRARQIVFTQAEVQEIREYADRVEPLDPVDREQLKLFNGAA